MYHQLQINPYDYNSTLNNDRLLSIGREYRLYLIIHTKYFTLP